MKIIEVKKILASRQSQSSEGGSIEPIVVLYLFHLLVEG